MSTLWYILAVILFIKPQIRIYFVYIEARLAHNGYFLSSAPITCVIKTSIFRLQAAITVLRLSEV